MDKDTKQLYLDLYKENQTFLNKSLFTLSCAALPLILKLGEKADGMDRLIVNISLFLFFVIICLHLYTHYIAKEGCDLALSEEDDKIEKATKHFDRVKAVENWKYGLFIVALVSFLMI